MWELYKFTKSGNDKSSEICKISGQWEKFCLTVKDINGRKVLVVIGSASLRGLDYG